MQLVVVLCELVDIVEDYQWPRYMDQRRHYGTLRYESTGLQRHRPQSARGSRGD